MRAAVGGSVRALYSTFTASRRGGSGPPIEAEITDAVLADAVERAMDEAGFEIAHVVGNSLGGYVALQVASRGRAETVVALAPAGGRAQGDEAFKDTLAYWGTDDKLLSWPSAAARFRNDWLHRADWVELEGIGHCPQIDTPLETAELILGLTSG